MMSEDPSAMMAAFTGAPSTYAPGSYGSVYDVGLEAASPWRDQPAMTAPSSGIDTTTMANLAVGIGKAGQSIAAGRAAQQEAKIAQQLAKIEVGRELIKGRRMASAARAITGAQGTTMEGSPLLAELQILQAATQDAKAQKYAGNINEYYAKQKAKKAFYEAPADLFSGFKKQTSADLLSEYLGGKSLLTGK
jgi:hypothetical protein